MNARQSPNEWRPTACILCYVNCGVEVMTEGRNLVRVRGDKTHPSTRGYLCQKAQRLNFYQNHADRLTTPLRRRADGSFAAIDWDTALAEIAQRLNHLRGEYGGKAFAFYGGGGQGNHLGGAYGVSLLRAMGSSNYYSALSQEKTGDFWVNGFLFGSQNAHTAEDVEHCDLLVTIGCNPWLAHGFRNARNLINEIKKDPPRHRRLLAQHDSGPDPAPRWPRRRVPPLTHARVRPSPRRFARRASRRLGAARRCRARRRGTSRRFDPCGTGNDGPRRTRHPAGTPLDPQLLPGEAPLPVDRQLRPPGYEQPTYLATAVVGQLARRALGRDRARADRRPLPTEPLPGRGAERPSGPPPGRVG